MEQGQISFKQALNDAVRAGLRPSVERDRFVTKTQHLGTPTVSLDRALALAGELEDDELIRKMRTNR